MLSVALGEGDEAADRWVKLRPSLDLDRLGPGSFVLLPLVYRRLVDAGVDDAVIPRLKGIYKSTWYKNNLLLESARESVQAFDRDGIRSLSIGGVFTAERFYGVLGLRPSAALEFLIEPGSLALAARALVRIGWSGRRGSTAPDGSITLVDDRAHRICVLRTSLARDFFPLVAIDDAYGRFFYDAETWSVRETTVRVLQPADEMLVALVTGVRVTPLPTIQWIPDVAAIVASSGGAVDWARLLELGVRGGQALRLRDGLVYLSERHGIPVPENVLSELRAVRPSSRERVGHVLLGARIPGLGGLPQAAGEHFAVAGDTSLARALLGLGNALQQRWGVDRGWQLPLAAARRVYRRIVERRSSA